MCFSNWNIISKPFLFRIVIGGIDDLIFWLLSIGEFCDRSLPNKILSRGFIDEFVCSVEGFNNSNKLLWIFELFSPFVGIGSSRILNKSA